MVIVREEARSLCIFVYEDACKIKGEKWNMIKNSVFPTAFFMCEDKVFEALWFNYWQSKHERCIT